MQRLVTLSNTYSTFINELESNENEWKRWYDLEKPENEVLPGIFRQFQESDQVDVIDKRFQTLLILRVLRPDRVVNGVKNFI